VTWFNLFDRREKFFVLLIAPEKISAVLFAVTRDRSVGCEKFWSDFPLESSRRWWSKIRPNWTVIAAVSPNLAYTANVSLQLRRDDGGKTPLTFPELENLLSRGMNQEFIKYRRVASQSLGVTDLDMVLADSRVTDFKIDGHRVHSPIGFTSHHLQTAVEITFIHRTLYELLRNFIRRPNFFFTSLARAKLTVLRKIYQPPFALAVLESPHSAVFQVGNYVIGHQDERQDLPWSAKEFLQVFMETWGVNEEIARDLYDLHRKEQLPTVVEEYVAKQFRLISDRLEESLRAVSVLGKVLVTSQEDIPLASRRFSFEKISLPLILEKMGFSLSGSLWPLPGYEQFSYCAPFLDFFSDQGSPEINRWLRRRLHWLGAMNYN
jgi:hypothetical protein